MSTVERKILAAAFSARDLGSRAAAAVAGAFPDKVGNTAVLHVDDQEKVKFVESKDWGAGRGALVGAAIGIIGGPPGMLLGGGVGALAAKLRDSGFNDKELQRLGESLVPNSSAVVVEIAADGVDTAQKILEVLGAQVVVTERVDADVAQLFDSERPPAPEEEAEPAAVGQAPST
jgi:uncharacterized membrane protein